MQIDEPAARAIAPLWRLAFRAGFLLAGIFAVLGMARWLHWMLRPAAWDYSLAPLWWHAHEMVFGFALPVVAGFLLTAVATWTGTRGTSGWRLQLLFAMWLVARVVLWLFPEWLALAWMAEMGFILLLLYELTQRVWGARQWRNMLFPPVLLLLALLSSASYYAAYYAADAPQLGTRLHYGAVWMITVLVVIIGGRVTPLFTGNRLGLKIPPLPAWLDNLTIGSTLLVGLLMAAPREWIPAAAMNALLLGASALQFYRLAHWRGWKTLHEPLLWSMHLSYLCIPMAMLALAASATDAALTKNAMHLLAVGSIGGMILAMMSRVSLGHTGRPLVVPAYLAVAFALVFLAAVIRAALPILDTAFTPWSWWLSAALWITAFGLFLLRYTSVLTAPRADGKPG